MASVVCLPAPYDPRERTLFAQRGEWGMCCADERKVSIRPAEANASASQVTTRLETGRDGVTPKPTRGTGVRRVLFVGDDVQVLPAIEHVIADLFSVATATSGKVALRMLDYDHFDVVVSDMRMSGMNGVEFLALARDFAPNCARIMLTDHVIDAQTSEALTEIRISAWLTKPCDAETFVAVLTDVVARGSL